MKTIISESFLTVIEAYRKSNTAILTRDGIEFWTGAVNLSDGYIEETHTYQEAKDADFHHSFIYSDRVLTMIDEGSAIVFIVSKSKDVELWNNYNAPDISESSERYLKSRILEQIKQI